MTSKRILAVVTLVGGFALAFGGCSASGGPGGFGGEAPEDDTGGAPPLTGGGGNGGSGGEPSLCDMDCSTIVTQTCLKAVCNDGMHPGPIGTCVVVNNDDGIACDDNVFCTANDSCLAGACTGGPANDCGIAAVACNEVICNEASQSCSTQPSANGMDCVLADLCVVGTTCSNGLCTGGIANDCFFAPIPNDCHVAVCNPSTGMCDPVPGNESDPCVNLLDLCSVNDTCAAGVCTGGSPKDCSGLTMGCFNGECNVGTGQCEQVAILAGGQCDEATDQCNLGICDVNGNCNATPANEGLSCLVDGCFLGQTCASGVCSGGTQILTCINGDDCCPAGCDLTNDDDCGCDFGLISDDTQLTDSVITGLLTANGHTFVNYNNNFGGAHTSTMTVLNAHETVIMAKHDRNISTAEANNLNAFVQGGGRLLVTGYDSLGSPTDSLLAGVVNCTGPADGPFADNLVVVNVSHPIMQGPAQIFTLSQALVASTTDHDQCGTGVNGVQLVTVSGSSSKLIVTDNVGSGQGKVIFWNGNGSGSGPLTDWNATGGTQPALQNMFVNVIDHLCQ